MASGNTNSARAPRSALAMAGGGPLGAIYEIGALSALAESIIGLDLNHLDMYVGVSAGAILSAALANGITPREMSRSFIEGAPGAAADDLTLDPFDPATLMRPALAEYGAALAKLPPLLARAAWHLVRPAPRGGRGLLRALEHLAPAVPTGLFSNDALRDSLERTFEQAGRSDDFRQLATRLILVATDLDSGQSVEFGTPGHDGVPISLAATASAALPGMFPPVEIDGRHYVDGALIRTLHASVALKAGARLVLCINPLVPYDDRAAPSDSAQRPRLADGGLSAVIQQTVRAVISSRMQIGMRQYADEYPHADVLLFEPDHADAELFFSNIFSYANRARLCEHAYQKMREQLWRRRHELAPVLARHGMHLDIAALRDAERSLVPSARDVARSAWLPLGGIADSLDDTLDDLGRYVDQVRRTRPAGSSARRKPSA